MVFSDPSCSVRVESIWGPGLGAEVVVAPPAEAAPDSFLEHGVGGGSGAHTYPCVSGPCKRCLEGVFRHTHMHWLAGVSWCSLGPALLPSPGARPLPHAYSCQELGPPLDTISQEPEKRTVIGKGNPGSWAPAWQRPFHSRPRPFVPARMGSGLGPGPGLCAGETPQEMSLAKWPPFPFSSLGHECAVSLPEAAQGGWLPCGASPAPSWRLQTLRGQGWAGAWWERVTGMRVCAYREGTKQDIPRRLSRSGERHQIGRTLGSFLV